MGVAMEGALYEACFAVLTKALATSRKQAITIVALVAGFAGTLSFPGNNALVSLVGWRGAVLVLSAIVSFIAAPLIWRGCRAAEAFGGPCQTPPAHPNPAESLGLARNPLFWLLAVGFATIVLNHWVLLNHLLPLMDEDVISRGIIGFASSMSG